MLVAPALLLRTAAFADDDPQSDYLRACADTRWSEARRLVVENPGAADDTLAVVVGVTAGRGTAFVAVDESRAPIVTQADDTDGDGTVDEIAFLLPVEAHGRRTVALLSAEAGLPAAGSPWRVEAHPSASWAPVRMQPTHSPGTTQHSTYLSPVNATRARELIARLDRARPMTLLECDDFRVLIGTASAQIEGMRPASLPPSMRGSTLREYLPDEPDMGSMARALTGPVRCRFQWVDEDATRRITVYRNGVIESEWGRTPPQVQVIACAYPYRYLQTGPGDAVRYSQMLEMRRDLPEAAALGFFGSNDASLRVEARGLTACDHQVWLDSGEIGWEVGMQAQGKETTEDAGIRAFDRMTRLTTDTYIAGGMHVTTWKGAGGHATLRYRVGNLGADALDAGSGLVRATMGRRHADVPVVTHPEPGPAVSVVFETTRIKVNRLHPNDINGWELRPITLAKRNPQPAYFRAQLVNHSDREQVLALSLEDAQWIHTAKVLSHFEMLKMQRFGPLRVPFFHEEAVLTPGGGATAVTVPAGASVPIEILVRPRPKTLGTLACRLRWGDGQSADLEVVVRPTILFMPMFAPVNDVGREFANLAMPAGAPFSYGVRFWGGYSPDLLQWYDAVHRDAERNGMWTYDPLGLRGLATEHGEAVAAGNAGVDLAAWTDGVLEALRNPRFADYRARIHTHDEIWEVLGRKGHYIVPLSWMIEADRRIVMNSPTAAWASFQEPAIDEPFKYHVKLPNDVAELFYYCGQDARLQQFARKVVEPRRTLFEQWRADPALMAGAGTEHPRQIMSFWISTQLHVNAYRPVRRQIWWLRHHGFDAFNSWATVGHYAPYAGRIMHWMLMTVGSYTIPNERGFLVTDRALAWKDMKQDMELITLIRLLREENEDEATRRKIDDLAAQALDASQGDAFDAARHHYVTALKLLRPDLLYLAPRDLYRGPIEAEPLPDLFVDDAGFRDARALPRISIAPLEPGSRRPRPTVDGILDNAYLEEGATMALRDTAQGSRLAAATTAHMARYENDLYVLFSCREPNMADLRTERARERDDPVWATDCVEIFIDRTGDGAQLMHIAVSAIGVRYDGRKDIGKAWSPDYDVAALHDDESWSVELRIPLASLGGAPDAGETWRMNFCRERHAGRAELGAWSATFGHFHQVDRFGFVQFE